MNHNPTLDGVTYHCPACAWRAVLATDRRIIQVTPGDAGHDHIGQARQQQAEAIAHVALTIDRINAHKRYCVELPRCDGLHVAPCEELKTGFCVCTHQHGYILTEAQRIRLIRAVIGEHR